MIGYKVFTHDLCSPIQGGKPVWNGTLPFNLPTREVDLGNGECAAGWNFCRAPETALRIAGLWPNGHPSRLFRVESDPDFVERGDKCRASTLHVVEEIVDLRPAITALSQGFDVRFRAEMIDEQLAWREALARPKRDISVVQSGLQSALTARSLNAWKLCQFSNKRNAWEAQKARAAWDAWGAWGARDARAARDARDAWGALTVFYAAKMLWISLPSNLLTVGLRDAYLHGLAIALPVGKDELGWAMD